MMKIKNKHFRNQSLYDQLYEIPKQNILDRI